MVGDASGLARASFIAIVKLLQKRACCARLWAGARPRPAKGSHKTRPGVGPEILLAEEPRRRRARRLPLKDDIENMPWQGRSQEKD